MRALQYLNRYLKKYRFLLLLGLLFTVSSRVFAVLAPSLVGDSITAIEQFVRSGETDLTKLDQTDGIVVTTGGQQRLVEGLNLLVSGTTEKLLISGVGKGVNKAVLVQELNLNDQQVSALLCCVELEYGALDTRGNALAARAWIDLNGLNSIRLVTANYHMPRAEIVFSRAMPDVEIRQWAVSPDALDIERWWQDPVIVRLLTREYAKYVAEIVRL